MKKQTIIRSVLVLKGTKPTTREVSNVENPKLPNCEVLYIGTNGRYSGELSEQRKQHIQAQMMKRRAAMGNIPISRQIRDENTVAKMPAGIAKHAIDMWNGCERFIDQLINTKSIV